MTVLTNVDPEYNNVEACQPCREIRQLLWKTYQVYAETF